MVRFFAVCLQNLWIKQNFLGKCGLRIHVQGKCGQRRSTCASAKPNLGRHCPLFWANTTANKRSGQMQTAKANTRFRQMRTANAQISRRIRAAWFGPSMSAYKGISYCRTYTLWKHAYSPPKNENFQINFFLIFSYFCSKHRLWYSFEPPRRGGSN